MQASWSFGAFVRCSRGAQRRDNRACGCRSQLCGWDRGFLTAIAMPGGGATCSIIGYRRPPGQLHVWDGLRSRHPLLEVCASMGLILIQIASTAENTYFRSAAPVAAAWIEYSCSHDRLKYSCRQTG